MEDSDVVTFTYTIDRMSKLEHKSRLMYDMDGMKVWSVIDYDSDKMYLIKGSKGALLIDAGMASAGANNLYEYCKQLAGTDNIDVYISHGHPDHTTQLGDFVQAGRKVYINEKDIPMALKYVNDKTVTAGGFTCISEGYQFDLGGVVLDNYDIPGHTPGCMMLLDKAHNVLYSSDQLGCNRRSVADSLTLVNNDVRVLLSSLRIFRDKVTALAEAGEIDLDKLVVWSGHDDYEIHDLLGHLDTLITAAQNIVDYGPATAMRVSVRNTGGSDGASFAGDRYANGGTGHFICMNGSKANVLAGEDYTAVDELDKKYRSDYSGGMSGAKSAADKTEEHAFYLQYKLKSSAANSKNSVISAVGEAIDAAQESMTGTYEYLANNVTNDFISSLIQGYIDMNTYPGDEQYVLITTKPFSQSGATTVYAYPSGTRTLTTSDGFEKEVECYRVMDSAVRDEILRDYETYSVAGMSITEASQHMQELLNK